MRPPTASSPAARACAIVLALHAALLVAVLVAPIDLWLLWRASFASSFVPALVGAMCFVRSRGSTGGVVLGAVAVGVAVLTWPALGMGPLPYAA